MSAICYCLLLLPQVAPVDGNSPPPLISHAHEKTGPLLVDTEALYPESPRLSQSNSPQLRRGYRLKTALQKLYLPLPDTYRIHYSERAYHYYESPYVRKRDSDPSSGNAGHLDEYFVAILESPDVRRYAATAPEEVTALRRQVAQIRAGSFSEQTKREEIARLLTLNLSPQDADAVLGESPMCYPWQSRIYLQSGIRLSVANGRICGVSILAGTPATKPEACPWDVEKDWKTIRGQAIFFTSYDSAPMRDLNPVYYFHRAYR